MCMHCFIGGHFSRKQKHLYVHAHLLYLQQRNHHHIGAEGGIKLESDVASAARRVGLSSARPTRRT